MKKRYLINVHMGVDPSKGEDYFIVDKYNFYRTDTTEYDKKHRGKHKKNAFVSFSGKQSNSILFQGEVYGNKNNPRKRKLIDDILVIGSILNGYNWCLYSRRECNNFPLLSRIYLEKVPLTGKQEIEKCFQTAINHLKYRSWQKQYENGFHLRMLLHRANIIHLEARYLSNIVLWEWLYHHLIEPNEATVKGKNKEPKLEVIINFILKYFWPFYKPTGKNIFSILRNQLAHSAKLPIDRYYAEDWMKQLEFESNYENPGIEDYVNFFDTLTQIIVLRTIGVNAEKMLQPRLKKFLDEGRL